MNAKPETTTLDTFQVNSRAPRLATERSHHQHQKMTGAPKPVPTHQQPKDNWHTPVAYQTLTGVNQSQCTPTLSVQAAQPPKSQPRYPNANPGCPI